MKSRTLPLLNHGIAMAGTGWPDDVSNQTGHMFGWLNEDHMPSASASVCDKGRYECRTKGQRKSTSTNNISRFMSSSLGSNLIRLMAMFFYIGLSSVVPLLIKRARKTTDWN
jgi:hypothetical protein